LVNLRLAAAAAVVASLAGCSFFGSGNEPVKPQQSQAGSADRAAQRVQLAALPGYLSDEDLSPVTAPMPRAGGFIGVPSRRPGPASGRAAPQPSAPPRSLTFARIVPARRLADLRPVAAALQPRSHTLADLMADQAWRQRTSRNLERLFQ
jgi:hypothetical protein